MTFTNEDRSRGGMKCHVARWIYEIGGIPQAAKVAKTTTKAVKSWLAQPPVSPSMLQYALLKAAAYQARKSSGVEFKRDGKWRAGLPDFLTLLGGVRHRKSNRRIKVTTTIKAQPKTAQPKTAAKPKVTILRLPQADYDFLFKTSRERGCTVSEVVSELIRFYRPTPMPTRLSKAGFTVSSAR